MLCSGIDNVLCSDPAVQRFLVQFRLTCHPCEVLRNGLASEQRCAVAMNPSIAFSDESQLQSLQAYMGAMHIPEIIDQAYFGRSSELFSSASPLRILFAEHFRPGIVLHVAAYLNSRNVRDFEIHVLSTNEESIHAAQELWLDCSMNQRVSSGILNFHVTTIHDFAESAIPQIHFDLIEYNGGLSRSTTWQRDLQSLRVLLSARGVLVATYFADNTITNEVRELVANRNQSFFLPFSLEPSRLVKATLEAKEWPLFAKDTDYLRFLGAEEGMRIIPYHRKEDVDESVEKSAGKAWTQSDILAAVSAENFDVITCLPLALCRPFGRILFC